MISKYLFSYRNTLHCCTEETPSKLMLSRFVKTRLALLNDNVTDKIRERLLTYHHGRREIDFKEGSIRGNIGQNDAVEKTFENVSRDKNEDNAKLDNKVVVEFEAKEMATEDSVSANDVCNSDYSNKRISEPFISNVLSSPKCNIRALARAVKSLTWAKRAVVYSKSMIFLAFVAAASHNTTPDEPMAPPSQQQASPLSRYRRQDDDPATNNPVLATDELMTLISLSSDEARATLSLRS
ncbi:hypothetical protein ILUMI_10968 [Ignelater luminosus]|uniref:Uncharacterized protein n=1 Tax=Ignelater luminosus TaxID=2038154 RepID=A0A8K0CWV3_IGNLU|nr:hypothetical protein ILUMI_10968 [Ignelater luminosus]